MYMQNTYSIQFYQVYYRTKMKQNKVSKWKEISLKTCLPARDSSYLRMCSTRLSTSWTHAFLAGLYDASSSDLRSYNRSNNISFLGFLNGIVLTMLKYKIKYVHFGEVVQTSRNQCLDMLQPEVGDRWIK